MVDLSFGTIPVLTEKLIDYTVAYIGESRGRQRAWDKVLEDGELQVRHDQDSHNFMLDEIRTYNNGRNLTCAAYTKFRGRKWWVNEATVDPGGFIGIFVRKFPAQRIYPWVWRTTSPNLGHLGNRPLQKFKVRVGRPLSLFLGDRTQPPISLWEYNPEGVQVAGAAQPLHTVSGSWYPLRAALRLPARPVEPAQGVPNRVGIPIPHAILFALATVLADAEYKCHGTDVCVPFKLVRIASDEYGYEYIGQLSADVVRRAINAIHRGRQWCNVYVRPGANFATSLY